MRVTKHNGMTILQCNINNQNVPKSVEMANLSCELILVCRLLLFPLTTIIFNRYNFQWSLSLFLSLSPCRLRSVFSYCVAWSNTLHSTEKFIQFISVIWILIKVVKTIITMQRGKLNEAFDFCKKKRKSKIGMFTTSYIFPFFPRNPILGRIILICFNFLPSFVFQFTTLLFTEFTFLLECIKKFIIYIDIWWILPTKTKTNQRIQNASPKTLLWHFHPG